MCRMLVGVRDLEKPLGFRIIKTCSILISLGKNPSIIDSRGVFRIFKALEKCQSMLATYKGVKVQCIATAIFRSASNAAEILSSIYDKFKLSFYVCDPGEEIMFSAYGCRDIMVHQLSFVMDMGGGSTEIGLFQKNQESLSMLKWISLPYGLFYFDGVGATNKSIPPDSYRALQFFLENNPQINNNKASLVICRSGIMTILSSYLCKKNKIPKAMVHGRVFDVHYIIQTLNSILQMTDVQIIESKLLTNTTHITSTRGTMIFTRDVLRKMPVQFVILGNGGVKEGMMSLVCGAK